MAPSTQSLLLDWTWEPSIIFGLLALAVAYWYATGPLRWRHHLGPPASRRQITWFVLAVAVVCLALLSPLDEIGDTYLFSAHMLQHLLLATLWPPMMLAAIPAWLVRPVLRRGVPAGIIEFLTYPVMAAIIFTGDIYVWHLPYLYDLTLRSEGVHILEHLTFMVAGLVVWWPVLCPARERRLSYPFQVLYLFANGMFMMVLGILFTFSPTVFYQPYAAAPRLWGISALTDQQIGGLIMWYPGNIPYAVALVVAFYRWFDGESATPMENSGIQTPTAEPPFG